MVVSFLEHTRIESNLVLVSFLKDIFAFVQGSGRKISHYQLFRGLKAVSAFINQRGFTKEFRAFINADVLFGYINVEGIPERVQYRVLRQSLEDWLLKDTPFTPFTRDVGFILRTKQRVMSYLRNNFSMREERLEEEYLVFSNLSAFGGSGSSGLPTGVRDLYTGKELKTKSALFWQDGKVDSTLRNKILKPVNKAFIKSDEIGKLRLVVNADARIFCMNNALDLLLQPLRDPANRGPIYNLMGMEAQTDFWVFKPGLYFPMDISSYDNQLSSELVVAVFRTIVEYLEVVYAGTVFAHWIPFWSREILTNMYAGVEFNGTPFQARKGILSGWKWTSLLGSLCTLSIAEEMLMRSNVKHKGLKVQGDDISLILKDVQDYDKLMSTIQELSAPINPKKTFLAFDRNEFLRKEISPSGVLGYPSRMVHTLLYAKPGSETEGRSIGTLQSMVDNWYTYFRRFDVRIDSYLVSLIARDISRYMEISMSRAMAFIFSNKAMGGGGLGLIPKGWAMEDQNPPIRKSGSDIETLLSTPKVGKAKLVDRLMVYASNKLVREGSISYFSVTDVRMYNLYRIDPVYRYRVDKVYRIDKLPFITWNPKIKSRCSWRVMKEIFDRTISMAGFPAMLNDYYRMIKGTFTDSVLPTALSFNKFVTLDVLQIVTGTLNKLYVQKFVPSWSLGPKFAG